MNMNINVLDYSSDVNERSHIMVDSIVNGIKRKHTMSNSSEDFQEVQNYVLNSYTEFLKCRNYNLVRLIKGEFDE